MPGNMNSLINAISELKSEYEQAILSKTYTSLIRSGKLIGILHDFATKELEKRIEPSWIYKDKKVYGFPKIKTQDILVQPPQNGQRTLSAGPFLSLNIRSQLSSIEKNYDTLFERLFAEALNLHNRFPYLVLGYLYLLPKIGYDEQAAKRRRVNLTEKYDLQKYILSFLSVTNREAPTDAPWKYEKICLLIVDFSKKTPIVMDDMEVFVQQQLVTKKFADLYSFRDLSIRTFFDDLVKMMNERHYLMKLK